MKKLKVQAWAQRALKRISHFFFRHHQYGWPPFGRAGPPPAELG
jgi:hypothetical protein